MLKLLPVFPILALVIFSVKVTAAPPLVHGASSPCHGSMTSGIAIMDPEGENRVSACGMMEVCIIRVEFLEDFTSTTSGNGLFNLDSDPPHDKIYVEGLAEDVTEYFHNVSTGRLTLEIQVFPNAPEEVYSLEHQMTYYGSDEKEIQGACELLRDAVNAADVDVDFSMFNAVIIMHAGSGQEADIYRNSPDDIHSVFLTLIDLINYLPESGLGYEGIPTNDGVFVAEGVIVPEQETQDGFGLGVLGTIVHEFFHQLGLPDLYDTVNGGVGVGGWDVMGYGQWLMSGFWPSSPSAWSRTWLGWTTVRTVEPAEQGTWSVSCSDTVLKVRISGTEYFLIENRQRDPDGNGMCDTDEHDWGLPGSGILIWHIDQGVIDSMSPLNRVNGDPEHKGVDLEEADGIQDFDYSLPDIYGYEGSEFDPYFVGGYGWILDPGSEPSSETSWGGNTFISIEVIDPPGNVMDVDISWENLLQGWPVLCGKINSGPIPRDSDGDGIMDQILVVGENGYLWCFHADGSFIAAYPIDAVSGVVVDNMVSSPGDETLWCDGEGYVHMTDGNGEEIEGWPVSLRGGGTHVLVSGNLPGIVVSTDLKLIYLLDFQGDIQNGWPVSVSAPVSGIGIFPSSEPSVVTTTAEGRIHRWNRQGEQVSGWPVTGGEEPVSYPFSGDFDRDGHIECAAVCGNSIYCFEEDGDLSPGFPAVFDTESTGSPVAADLDNDGYLEILIEAGSRVFAIEATGSTLIDWPRDVLGDTLLYEFQSSSLPVGGSGFALSFLRDGRIFNWDNEGKTENGFPLSVGDNPAGSPLLIDMEGDGSWELFAADRSGFIGGWQVEFSPDGWFSGMDRGREKCWWNEDLPQLLTSSGILEDGSFFVYPNPVCSGEGTIRFIPEADCSYSVRIFNIAGELVDYFSGQAYGGMPWEIEWQTKDFSPGVYFVSLEISGEHGSQTELFHAAVIN